MDDLKSLTSDGFARLLVCLTRDRLRKGTKGDCTEVSSRFEMGGFGGPLGAWEKRSEVGRVKGSVK